MTLTGDHVQGASPGDRITFRRPGGTSDTYRVTAVVGPSCVRVEPVWTDWVESADAWYADEAARLAERAPA